MSVRQKQGLVRVVRTRIVSLLSRVSTLRAHAWRARKTHRTSVQGIVLANHSFVRGRRERKGQSHWHLTAAIFLAFC
jgi:hypothetical protein